MKHQISDLYQMQALPLDIKIKMTEFRIREWYNHYGGEVYCSFSGGKDSTEFAELKGENSQMTLEREAGLKSARTLNPQ